MAKRNAMGVIWCAQHKDGWCAIKPNRKPPEGVSQVETKCSHFICLPWGIAPRTPTCIECRKAIGEQP